MITKYIINKDTLIININYLYDVENKINSKRKLMEYIIFFISNKKIKFQGKKIIIYQDGILIAIIYLTAFYLKKIKFYLKDTKLTEKNCYFYLNNLLEINQRKISKTKQILNY